MLSTNPVGNLYWFNEEAKISLVCQPYFESMLKYGIFLLFPDKVDPEAFEAWLSEPGDNTGRGTDSYDLLEGGGYGVSHLNQGECFAQLHRWEDAAKAAQIDLERFPLNPAVQLFSHALAGRCHAMLGQFNFGLLTNRIRSGGLLLGAHSFEPPFNTLVSFPQCMSKYYLPLRETVPIMSR